MNDPDLPSRIRVLDFILNAIAVIFGLVIVFVLIEFLTGEPSPTPDYDNLTNTTQE